MSKSIKTELKTDEILETLKSFDFIHSILLFGSRARGKTGRDIDICIIPSRETSLRERLSIDSAMPSGVDISMYHELPVHIRKRIAEEGKVLYTKDMYHLLTLLKENDLEYAGYRRYREYYNKAIREMSRESKGLTLNTEDRQIKCATVRQNLYPLKPSIILAHDSRQM